MEKVELIGAAKLEGLGFFLDHLHQTEWVDGRMFAKLYTPRVDIGVNFFDAESCCFHPQLGLLEQQGKVFGQ